MLKAGVLALALSAAAASVQAAPLFDVYQGFCLKTDAEAASGLAAATAAGWMPIPNALLQQMSAGAGIENAQGLMHSSAAGLDFFLVGAKKMPVGPMTLDLRFCSVGSTGTLGSSTDIATALASWAGTPPNPVMSKGGLTGYVFLNEDGAHRPVVAFGDVSTGKAMIQSGHLRFAFFQESSSLQLLAFGVPSTTSPN